MNNLVFCSENLLISVLVFGLDKFGPYEHNKAAINTRAIFTVFQHGHYVSDHTH